MYRLQRGFEGLLIEFCMDGASASEDRILTWCTNTDLWDCIVARGWCTESDNIYPPPNVVSVSPLSHDLRATDEPDIQNSVQRPLSFNTVMSNINSCCLS